MSHTINTDPIESELLKAHMNINWLRPETIVWDVVASMLLGNTLNKISPEKKLNALDAGSGNGLFTFLCSGGRLTAEYDWFFNVEVETEGFHAKNKDIYDSPQKVSPASFISKEPTKTWALAIDHKPNLLDQAAGLKLYEDTQTVDLNADFELKRKEFDFVFSNVLYWLAHPWKAMRRLENDLKPGGTMAIMTPNKKLPDFCRSFRWKECGSAYLEKVNRGRLESYSFFTDRKDLENGLKQNQSRLKIVHEEEYLSKQTLEFWDQGLRLFQPVLIPTYNGMSRETRLQWKQEWVKNFTPLISAQLKEEATETRKTGGGYTYYVLTKE